MRFRFKDWGFGLEVRTAFDLVIVAQNLSLGLPTLGVGSLGFGGNEGWARGGSIVGAAALTNTWIFNKYYRN